jgi:hypothetical protein
MTTQMPFCHYQYSNLTFKFKKISFFDDIILFIPKTSKLSKCNNFFPQIPKQFARDAHTSPKNIHRLPATLFTACSFAPSYPPLTVPMCIFKNHPYLNPLPPSLKQPHLRVHFPLQTQTKIKIIPSAAN